MPQRILILEGHPDPRPERFCHALADAYAEGAAAAGHELRRVSVAALDVPLLADKQEWETGDPPAPIRRLQDDITWAGHLVVIFPLWLGGMPARMRGVLEQTFRPHFGSAAPAAAPGAGELPRGLLRGKTARIVVTMGMPALLYRWYFGAHGLKSLERGVLRLLGIGAIGESLIGRIDSGGDARRRRWLERMRALGRRGA